MCRTVCSCVGFLAIVIVVQGLLWCILLCLCVCVGYVGTLELVSYGWLLFLSWELFCSWETWCRSFSVVLLT
jgi:hypothetical protein